MGDHANVHGKARCQAEDRRQKDALGGSVRQPTAVSFMTQVLVVLAGAPAAAQEAAAPLNDLLRTGLAPGDAVYVTDAQGERTEGRVSEISATGLTIANGDDAWTWTETEIARIEAKDGLANGIWIGVAIGVGAFLMRCHYGDNKTGICPIIPYAVTGGYVQLGLGAYLGALFDRHMTRTLYPVPEPARVEVSPLLSRDRVGARLTVGW